MLNQQSIHIQQYDQNAVLMSWFTSPLLGSLGPGFCVTVGSGGEVKESADSSFSTPGRGAGDRSSKGRVSGDGGSGGGGSGIAWSGCGPGCRG